MQDIKREVKMLETGLQLLGGLHKMNRGNKDARQADIEKVAEQCKARCMSIKFKLEILEKELKAEKENNIKLSKELCTTREQKQKSEQELNQLNSIL
jgi:chromosome segregation ATPase